MRKIHILYIVIIAIIIIALGLFLSKKFAYAPADIVTIPMISYDGGATPDIIKITSIKAGDSISSPLEIYGQARGNWYFEASFPITIVDWDGLIIGQGHATAQSDWMTEGLVPFAAKITFTKPVSIVPGTYNEKGAIIIKNDNPSGDPTKDMSIEIPIKFK